MKKKIYKKMMENLMESVELNYNILDAVSRIGKKLEKSKLTNKALHSVQCDTQKVADYLSVSELQAALFCIVFAINYNDDKFVDIQILAKYIDTTIVAALRYYRELEALSEKGIFTHRYAEYKNLNLVKGIELDFMVESVIAESIMQNVKPILSSKQKEKTVFDLVRFVGNRYFGKEDPDERVPLYRISSEFEQKEREYTSIPAVTKIKEKLNDENRILFYDFCYDKLCCNWCDSSDLVSTLANLYGESDLRKYVEDFKKGKNILQKLHLVEMQNDETIKRPVITVTDKGLEFLLEEQADLYIETISEKDLIVPAKIAKKELFFSDETDEQISLLKSSLESKKFRELQNRLAKEKMPKGICVLFYGYPGTGKTESVYQIAKATKRKIYHVDISQTKSCWFGESEKLIKEVFEKYKRLCKTCCDKKENIPILLFNEADAIFSKRKESISSNVAQTENAIQNIILEQMETLDGILIATTNLENNFDTAFERRFLFKVKFEKPTIENRAKIWRNKLNSLSENEALYLAENYNFSGGEIDNIVRKSLMQNIISGEERNLENIEELCKTEKLHADSTRTIGFRG